MRKHLYTSAVVLLAVINTAQSQFSEIWTNGDLFKVNEMASQCYSASVERCVAAGVTPDSLSWWDYLLGKNHAKQASVKANIEACVPYYAPPNQDFTASRSPFSAASLQTYCGLPTNSLDEIPYFKTQYASTTGGWHSTWRMLTGMVVAVDSYGYALYEGFLPASNCVQIVWADGAAYSTNTYTDIGFDYITNGLAWYDFATRSSNQAERATSDRYWDARLSDIAPENFEFAGECYAAADAVGLDSFDQQGDNVGTNTALYLTWTNAYLRGFSPSFRISTNTYVQPPNYDPANPLNRLGYYFYSSFFVYRFTATTNGFKYR